MKVEFAALWVITVLLGHFAIVRAQSAPTSASKLTGQSVHGQIELPKVLDQQNWIGNGWLEKRLTLSEIKLPNNVLLMLPAERLAWFNQWTKTVEGQRTLSQRDQLIDDKRKRTEYAGNNSFRIDGLSPGVYTMTVRFRAKSKATADSDVPLATAAYQFTVPRSSRDAEKTLLDLGTLPQQTVGITNAGQSIPDIAFPTIDGKEHLLSEFRGKYIWLDFWGVWCPDCHQDLPNLKHLYKTYGQNPDFKMISLSIDDEPATWKDYIAKNDMKWMQGILGPRDDAWQAKLFEVTSYPTYWLIGPDGKVIGNSYLCDDLEPLLAKAMDKRP
jgi:thiol-disulfide isomerase/thioredoxin